MIQELVFTSARSGLQIGKSGFCTVASTPGMAENLVRLLESLSGYRHVFPAGSTSAAQNPVVYSHFTSRVGGQPMHILSRIADAGLDYSNRSNKIAHHVVVPNAELSDGDPIGILTEPDQFVTRWDREPEKLRPRTIEGRYLMPAPCATWQRVTGDAGWAGSLVDAFLSRQIAYVIVDSATPVLALIGEALALLPAEDRWRVTFSSYFTNLPPQTECLWRFVMADSPEAATALRSPTNRVINTTLPLPSPSNRFADAARAGETIQTNVSVASAGLLAIDDSESDLPLAKSLLSAAPANGDLRIRPPENMASGQKQINYARLHRPPQMDNQSERSSIKITVRLSIVAAVCLLLAVVSATILFTDSKLSRLLAEFRSSRLDKAEKDQFAKAVVPKDAEAAAELEEKRKKAEAAAELEEKRKKAEAAAELEEKRKEAEAAADKAAEETKAAADKAAAVITLVPTKMSNNEIKNGENEYEFDVCQINGDVSKLKQSLVVDLDITLLDSDKYQITKQTGPDKYCYDIKLLGTPIATLELISPDNNKAMMLRFKLREATERAVCDQFVRISSKDPDSKELQIEGPIVFPLSDPSVATKDLEKISAVWNRPPLPSDSSLRTRLWHLKGNVCTELPSNVFVFDDADFSQCFTLPDVRTCKITYDAKGKKHMAHVSIKASTPDWVGNDTKLKELIDVVENDPGKIKGLFKKNTTCPNAQDLRRAFSAKEDDEDIGAPDKELRLFIYREATDQLLKFFQAVKDEEEAKERRRRAEGNNEIAAAKEQVDATHANTENIKKTLETKDLASAGELEAKLKDVVLFGYSIDPTPDVSFKYIKAFYFCNMDLAPSNDSREKKLQLMISMINDHIAKDWNSISKELSGTVPRDEQ